MKVGWRVAVCFAVLLAFGIAMVATESIPLVSNEWLRTLVIFPLTVAAATAVTRRLTGWPAKAPRADQPLPIEGDGGTWTVSLYDPRPKVGPVSSYLTKEHRVTPSKALAAVAHDPLPLVIGEAMSEEAATKLAGDLRGLGASVSVRERRD